MVGLVAAGAGKVRGSKLARGSKGRSATPGVSPYGTVASAIVVAPSEVFSGDEGAGVAEAGDEALVAGAGGGDEEQALLLLEVRLASRVVGIVAELEGDGAAVHPGDEHAGEREALHAVHGGQADAVAERGLVGLDVLDGITSVFDEGGVAVAEESVRAGDQAELGEGTALDLGPMLQLREDERGFVPLRSLGFDAGRFAGAQRMITAEGVVGALVEVVHGYSAEHGDRPVADVLSGSVVQAEAPGAEPADVDPTARQARTTAVDALVGIADQEQIPWPLGDEGAEQPQVRLGEVLDFIGDHGDI